MKIITELEKNQIFVFGSNLAGIHGAGAAKTAYMKFFARWGVGIGRTGQCFALPTKDRELKILPLETIRDYVFYFLSYATLNPKLQFLVTPIGCGLSRYKPKDIAPFFKNRPDNVILPPEFCKFAK